MSIAIIIISLFAFLLTYKMLPHFIEKFATIVNLPIGEFKAEEDKIAINRFVITGFLRQFLDDSGPIPLPLGLIPCQPLQ